MRQIKRTLIVAVAVLGVYAATWTFGDHAMTYTIMPATQMSISEWICPENQADGNVCYTEPTERVVQKWICKPGEDGPFTAQNSHEQYECRLPTTTCPILWF